MKTFFANFIFCIHILIIIFMVCAPFSNDGMILLAHVMLSPMLLAHWKLNNDTCGLTIIEQQLRGCEKTDSFINRIISPVYTLNQNTTLPVMQITVLLWVVSVVRLSKKMYTHRDQISSALAAFWAFIKNIFS